MKKILSFLFSIAFCFYSFPNIMIGSADEWKPFKGNGTEDDPYQISSKYELFLLAELINDDDRSADYYNKHYIQTNDIDLKNENFTPIGTREESGGRGFSGVYNGNYKNINNLYVEREYNFNGLFGWAYGGIIENLTVYGEINCPNSSPCGGIVGDIGSEAAKYIKNCAFIGNVTGKSDVGGIAGTSWLSCTIENCYFNGELHTENGVSGGIIGSINNGGSSTVKNCYAVSNSNNTFSGGVIGSFNRKSETSTYAIENNYYLNTIAKTGINGDYTSGCSKLSSALMKAADERIGSPFIHNTDESINNGYPIFEWQGTPYHFKGNGTEDAPYQISSKEDLYGLKSMVRSPYFQSDFDSKYYIQTQSIDLNNELWNPNGFVFKGNYNGNHQSITNLKIESDDHYIGLFGLSYGKIYDLSVYGNVTSTKSYVGGIVGEIRENAVISNCSFNGNIIGKDNVGGITGKVYKNGSVISCYHIGNVEASKNAGGILGYITPDAGDVTVKSCYHTGKVSSSDDYAGGIVGKYIIDEKNTVNISNCFYTNSDASTGVNEVGTISSTKRETTTFSEKNLDGWILDESLTELGEGPWSEWSEWGRNKIDSSDNCQVETRQIEEYTDWGGWSEWAGNAVEGNNMREVEKQTISNTKTENVHAGPCSSTQKSLVDGLKECGCESSKEFRASIAPLNGIYDYSLTAEQNNKMLNLLKDGKLVIGQREEVYYTDQWRYRERSVNNITEYRSRTRTNIPTVYHFYRDVEESLEKSVSGNSNTTPVSSKLLKKVADDLSSPFITNSSDEFNDGYPIFEWQSATKVEYGDANCDGNIALSDAVIIMQSICNPSKYGVEGTDENRITLQGQKNADCSNPGDGVTNADALAIQKYTLHLISSLPEKK